MCALQEPAPLRRRAVEDGDPQVGEVRPGCDLRRPHGRGDELRRDHQRMAPVPVADQFSDRRERGSAFAGAEGRDQKGGVALVEIRR
jgi:hypothetical protein